MEYSDNGNVPLTLDKEYSIGKTPEKSAPDDILVKNRI